MANARWDDTVAALQAETGMVTGEVALLAGYNAAGDGGGGTLYFTMPAPSSMTVANASSTSPITITTSTAHGLIAGQQVMVAGVQGLTGSLGTWIIGTATAMTFTLVGSSGSGAYTTGGSVGDGNTTFPSNASQGVWTRATIKARWDTTVAALQNEIGMVNGEVASLAGYYAAGDGGGGTLYFTTPAISSRTVVGASNASPITITTSTAHGLLSGQRIMVAGVGGNAAANGTWTIASAAGSTFTLVGSLGSGTYTSGGTIGDGGTTIPSGSATQGTWTRIK